MIRTHAKLGSRRRDGRDLVWGLAALAFACALLGRPHPAEAGDCSAKTDCRYVPDNGNAVLPVAAGATGVAVGTGLRRRRRRGPATEPVYKPPKDYTDPATGGRRDNPWDPPIDEQRDRWNRDHLVWDPGTLSWRPPKPGEVPPPPGAPENTPFQRTNPRDGTPPECLDLYDQYVQAQRDVQQLEVQVQVAANHLQNAQLYLNQNLVKLTLQLQMDTADIFMAGSSGVKSGMGIATAVAHAPEAIAELLRAAMTKAKYLEEVVARLIEAAGELGARLSRIESSVSTFSASTDALAAEASEAGTAVEAAEGRVSRAQQRVNLSSQVDELAAQRDAVVQEATDAEKKLGIGEKYWERKQGLKEWAESEQAGAREQGNRAFAAAHGELEDAKAHLESLRSRNPEEIRAAEQATQAKLDQVRQAKVDLEKVRQPQYEITSAEQVQEQAQLALDSIDEEIAKNKPDVDAYWEELNKVKAKEAEAQLKVNEVKRRLKQANVDLDAANAEIEAAAERRRQADPSVYARRQAAVEARSAASADLDPAQAALNNADFEVQKVQGKPGVVEPSNPVGKAKNQRNFDLEYNQKPRAERNLQIAKDKIAELKQKSKDVPFDQIPELEQERVRLTREYDELRAQEEKLKTGGFTDEGKAAELRTKIAQLEQRLREWKDPDWEDYAVKHDPQKYQQWKLEVEGSDPGADAANDLAGLREKVASLKQREDQLEKQIGDLRDQLRPETTTDSPQTALAQAQDDLQTKKQAADAKKQALDQARQQLQAAQTELTAVRAERDKKQQELQQSRQDLDAANAEVSRLQSGGAPAGTGQAPGDTIDQVAQMSHSASQAVRDAVSGAGGAPAQYIADKLRSAVGKVGKAWEWAFNGQSPDEIAHILKSQHDAVQHWVDELNQKQQDLDAARGALRDLKPQLDACVAAHHDTA